MVHSRRLTTRSSEQRLAIRSFWMARLTWPASVAELGGVRPGVYFVVAASSSRVPFALRRRVFSPGAFLPSASLSRRQRPSFPRRKEAFWRFFRAGPQA